LAPIPDADQQPELFQESDDRQKHVEGIRALFRLSKPQAQRLRMALNEFGMDYVKEKVEIVKRMEPENGARALMAALKDDWQPPVKIRKEHRRSPAAEPPPVEEQEEIRRKIKEQIVAYHQSEGSIFR